MPSKSTPAIAPLAPSNPLARTIAGMQRGALHCALSLACGLAAPLAMAAEVPGKADKVALAESAAPDGATSETAEPEEVIVPLAAEDAQYYLLVNGAHDGSDDAVAFGQYAIALGASAYADGEGASAFGSGAFALAPNATATGYNATAFGARSAAYGDGSTASGQDSTAIGGRAEIFFGGLGFQYVATTASGNQATAVGAGAQATGDVSVALGSAAQAGGALSVAVLGAASGEQSLSIGANSKALAYKAIALGAGAVAVGDESMALGENSAAAAQGSALGVRAKAIGEGSVALGADSVADRDNAVSVGRAGSEFEPAIERQITNVAAGTEASDAVNLGQLEALADSVADASAYFSANGLGDGSDASTAEGDYATASGSAATALGTGASAYGSGAFALGEQASASGFNSVAGADGASAFGAGSQAMAANSTALGTGSVAEAGNSVALGAGSIADRANSVSVGSVGGERQITHVAAGTDDTDAVNVAQLRAAGLVDEDGNAVAAVVYDDADKDRITLAGSDGTTLDNLADGSIAAGSRAAVNGGQLFLAQAAFADALGGGAMPGANGALVGPSYRIQGGAFDNVGSALEALDSAINGLDLRLDQVEAGGGHDGIAIDGDAPADVDAGSRGVAIGSGASSGGNEGVAIGADARVGADADNAVALGSGSVADRDDSVSVGSAGHERQITNVADGTADTDAANLRQVRAGDAATLGSAKAYTDQRFAVFEDQFETLREDVWEHIGEQDRRVSRVGAMSAAMVHMTANAANGSSERGRIAIGAGFQGGEQAISIGYGRRIGERGSLTIGGAFSEDENSAGVGFGLDL